MSRTPKICIIDDEERFTAYIADMLHAAGYHADTYHTADAYIRALHDGACHDVAVIDINMPGMSGLKLIDYLKTRGVKTECIVLTGHGTVESAVQAMRQGCFDFLEKPVRMDVLQLVILQAWERRTLALENEALKDGRVVHSDAFAGLVGDSPALTAVRGKIAKIAPTDLTVLVTGESGTGKEVVAAGIHRCSNRRDRHMVVLDCTALPENLIESELFGHEKGAFTDAGSSKQGLVEIADGGTLFIDEIGELRLEMQAKLLRLIETGEYRRIGSVHRKKTDVRIIAATNRDLADEVRRERFRKDLYYRINQMNIHLPPLREHPEDIPALVAHFIRHCKAGRQRREPDQEAMRALMAHRWPGNVRELKNTIERALCVCEGDRITVQDLGLAGQTPHTDAQRQGTLSQRLKEFERSVLEHALRASEGDWRRAVSMLGIGKTTYFRKLKEHNLQPQFHECNIE